MLLYFYNRGLITLCNSCKSFKIDVLWALYEQQRSNFCFLKVTSEILHSIFNCKFNEWYVFPREDENSRFPVGFYHVGKSANNRQLKTGNQESFDLILFLINKITILF